MKKLKLFLLLLPLIFFVFAFKPKLADGDLLKKLAAKLEVFYSNYPQGKIYIHQDKPLYSIGETIWFKTYLTLSPKTPIDTLNKIVYVDLISPKNKILFNRRLEATGGTANGDIYLPDTLAEGTYQLRAYTNWMRNFSPDYFFSREINITKPDRDDLKAGISFNTHPYANGDSLTATLHFYKLPFEPAKQLPLTYQLEIDGKKHKKQRLQTDDKGAAELVLNLERPKDKSIEQAILYVTSDAEGEDFSKTYNLPIGKRNLDLQFFPEGGNLVNGLVSKVAFKAVDITGKGTDVAGGIYDNLGNRVADFKSKHLGMGMIVMKPEQGKTYEARLEEKGKSTASFPLPQALDKGIVMSLYQLGKSGVRLTLANTLSRSAQDSTFIVAHAEGNIFFAAKALVGNDGIATNIPTDKFPTGLVSFTVFNGAGQPLAERLAFVRQPEKLNIAITTDKQVYGQREKVSMKVKVQDTAGNPVKGNFSLAVHDALDTPVPTPNPENIYTYFFLSSELKGNIEQPAHYFDKNNPDATQHLDLLLMTQGWRRFSWADILQDKFPPYKFPIEQNISISGVVEREFNKKKTVGKTNLSLFFKKDRMAEENIPAISMAETTEDGRFYLHGLHYHDTLNVFVQARTQKGGDNLIVKQDALTPPPPAFSTFADAYEYSKLSESYMNKMAKWAQSDRAFRVASGEILLKEVQVTAKKAEPDLRKWHSKEFTDAIINLENEKVYYPNVLQYLYKVAGVQVVGSGMNMSVSIRGGGTPQFLLDGMPVELDMVQMLSPTDIETIEVLKGANASVYRQGGSGVILLYTKRGNPNYDISKTPAPGAISFKLPGYYKAKEFYVPRYDVADERHNLPDYRNTLHWQPSLLTDAEGKAELTFFTSDDVTSFTTTCEGMAATGAVGTGKHQFEVNKKL
ncbi:TonB-dependent receptor [Pontibacter harenae]|uniref:TonB-dependent receptor n=1 Tax=Pontibacter harenae TaxID=2894083 RepID=UPI001E51B136|nr:TonB-dependent receptor plug domain-containing protein [Pontibacter harenae]MCC9168959.1 TonB-dependent receptor plug domain-containing protein [Pontibacter harenae]